jgi:hypothetical protein
MDDRPPAAAALAHQIKQWGGTVKRAAPGQGLLRARAAPPRAQQQRGVRAAARAGARLNRKYPAREACDEAVCASTQLHVPSSQALLGILAHD